jgi:hypothetical protein
MKITFESLIQRLINKGTTQFRAEPVDTSSQNPISIRFKPETRRFLDHQANALNTSLQSVISIILDGVVEASTDDTQATLRTIRERFFYLFQTHNIDHPGIVSIMKPYGFTLSALGDNSRLLDLLDQKTIQFLASVFSVRPEWISGASDLITPIDSRVRWYKNIFATATKLLEYAMQGLKPRVLFIKREGSNFEAAYKYGDADGAEREPIGVIVELHRKTDDGVAFTTYQVWEFERWNYVRCREQIKHFMLFCEQASKFVDSFGLSLPAEDIDRIKSSTIMPAAILSNRHYTGWYPDDYASFNDENVTKEIEDWSTVRNGYDKERYARLIDESVTKNNT